MKLIIALGNPGAEYARSRHNAGWLVADRITAGWEPFAAEGPVAIARGTVGGEAVWVLKPQTYMNRSGMAFTEWLDDRPEVESEISRPLPTVGEAAADDEGTTTVGCANVPDGDLCEAPFDSDAPPEKEWPGLLVVTDDVNLPLGRMRFRPGGSDGGHNGLADMAAALGSEAYPRLRVGVGAAPAGGDLKDWVLGPFATDEAALAERMWAAAADAVAAWAADGLERARDRFNGMTVTAEG